MSASLGSSQSRAETRSGGGDDEDTIGDMILLFIQFCLDDFELRDEPLVLMRRTSCGP